MSQSLANIGQSAEITITPVIIAPQGATSVERKLDVVATASAPALQANIGLKGKVGDAIRGRFAGGGLVGIVRHAASGNYRALAEHIALNTGEAVVISGRAAYEALPDLFEGKILTAKMGKAGGMRANKDGILVPTAKVAMLTRIRDEILAIHEAVREEVAARKAQAERDEAERDAEIKRLMDAAEQVDAAVEQAA